MKVLFISILTIMILTGCSDESKNKSNEKMSQKSSKLASMEEKKGIVLTDTQGKSIKVKKLETGFIFEGYEGKVVLINFFATWCPPCKAEIPHLNNLQKNIKMISR